jgi:hypothetical protein
LFPPHIEARPTEGLHRLLSSGPDLLPLSSPAVARPEAT